MMIVRLTGALALALLVAACGSSQDGNSQKPAAADGGTGTAPADSFYSGTGTVQSVSGDEVAIAHGPIPAIGWPAMTMTFTAPPGMAGTLKTGDRVEFSFRKTDGAYVLTAVKPQ